MDKIRVRVTVRVWIVWYMDAQMAARFNGWRWAGSCLHAFAYFLQRVSIACYAERCISYDRFCLTV